MFYAKKYEYQQKEKNILILSRRNPKAFWQHLKGTNNTCKPTNSIKANELKDYFRDLLNEDILPVQRTDVSVNIGDDDNVRELNIQITPTEIQDSVNAIKRGKSPGPDGICIEMYQKLYYLYRM